MGSTELNNGALHDAEIADVRYDGREICLYVHLASPEGETREKVLKAKVEPYDISIFQIKQYPVLRKVKIRGTEISFKKLQAFFKSGKRLCISEILASVDSERTVFECDAFPYSRGRGVYKKIILDLGINCDNIEITDSFKQR